MGGKSRKTGVNSKLLIERLKAAKGNPYSSKGGSSKKGGGMFDGEREEEKQVSGNS